MYSVSACVTLVVQVVICLLVPLAEAVIMVMHMIVQPTNAQVTLHYSIPASNTSIIVVQVTYNIHNMFCSDFGQNYHAPQVLPNQYSNSSLLDHDSTFHVTETYSTFPKVVRHTSS